MPEDLTPGQSHFLRNEEGGTERELESQLLCYARQKQPRGRHHQVDERAVGPVAPVAVFTPVAAGVYAMKSVTVVSG